ncbi:hypothetical protein Avbf_15082, partial [Armadillidium vulgare]
YIYITDVQEIISVVITEDVYPAIRDATELMTVLMDPTRPQNFVKGTDADSNIFSVITELVSLEYYNGNSHCLKGHLISKAKFTISETLLKDLNSTNEEEMNSTQIILDESLLCDEHECLCPPPYNFCVFCTENTDIEQVCKNLGQYVNIKRNNQLIN